MSASGHRTSAIVARVIRRQLAWALAIVLIATGAFATDAAGTPTANLLTGGTDQTFSRTDAAGTRTFLTDALGSTVALVDGTGAITTSYTYEPYGKTTVTGTASTNAQQFTGRENDGPLYFNRACYLHPTFGRFISEDPVGFAAGDPNLYAYVGGSPTNATDPSGLIAPILVIGAGCAAGAAAYGAFTVLGNLYANTFMGKRKDLFGGLDVVGAAISCGTGIIGGIVAGAGWTLSQRVAIGAISGFDSTLVAQANSGRFDPGQLVLGAAGGGAFAPLPIPAAHESWRVVGGGFVLNVGVGAGQTVLQELFGMLMGGLGRIHL